MVISHLLLVNGTSSQVNLLLHHRNNTEDIQEGMDLTQVHRLQDCSSTLPILVILVWPLLVLLLLGLEIQGSEEVFVSDVEVTGGRRAGSVSMMGDVGSVGGWAGFSDDLSSCLESSQRREAFTIRGWPFAFRCNEVMDVMCEMHVCTMPEYADGFDIWI